MIEKTIIGNLIRNESYCRKVLIFIKPDYFETYHERIIIEKIQKFYDLYNAPPSQSVLLIEIGNHINQDVIDYLNEIEQDLKDVNEDWLVDATEKFCKDRAVLKAIVDSFEIIEGKNKNLSKDSIPSLLSEALAISFDSSVGHDYFSDYQNRYEFYHKQDDKLSFDLDLMNKITRGGLSRKTLNLIFAPPKCGKTMLMTHIASATIKAGKNVLFISMEMGEERIAERVDANLLDVDIAKITGLDYDTFKGRIEKIIQKSYGRLMIKEYPPLSAHAGHFKSLIEELKLKKNFIPDLICIDYLNICSSSRLKQGGSVNTYSYVKSVSEELRGLASEYDVPILSANQGNRNSYENTDIDMTDMSDSWGIGMTADLIFAMIRTEELDKMNQVMIKQIANRYNDINYYKRFVIGRDVSKMRFFDLDGTAQVDNLDDSGYNDSSKEDTPVFDKSTFGKRKQIKNNGFNF